MSDFEREAFERYRDDKNARLEAEGHKPGSRWHVDNSHYATWQAARSVGYGDAVESRPLPVNRYGVDRDYFTKNLQILIRDMRDYKPDELARSLGRLAMAADTETMREAEFNGTRPLAAKVPEGLAKHIRKMMDLHEKRGVVLSVHMQELEELLSATPQPEAGAGQWVIQLRGEYLTTRGIWECADHRGYTNDIHEAGRYSEAEAKKSEGMAPEKYKAVCLTRQQPPKENNR